jgi:hypothetical protein
MTTFTVKAFGGDYTSLNSALAAVANGTITDVAGHVIVLYQIGSEPTSGYTFTGTGAGATRVNQVTIRPATVVENGVPLTLDITKTMTFTAVRSIRWDCSGVGTSRLRFRALCTFQGASGSGSGTTGCHNWSFIGDRTQECGSLDGEANDPATGLPWKGNLFVQYGNKWNRLNDDITYDGVSFIMRRSGSTSGNRCWSLVTCLKVESNISSAQARHSQRWLVRNCEMAYYATDGFQVIGLEDSTIEGCEIHHLYPSYEGNNEHIDGLHILQSVNLTVQRNHIHHTLYQGIWVKCDSTPNGYTGSGANNINYSANRGIRILHNRGNDFGGPYIDGEPYFTNTLGYNNLYAPYEYRLYIDTGGQGLGVTNVASGLVSGNVFVENFNNPGLEVNYQSNSLPISITTPGDMNVDFENNVFSYAASEQTAGKLGLNIGDPGFDGTWKNNLQTVTKSSNATYIVVTAQVGDIATGTSPQWDTDYRPTSGSPLINAGYDSTLSTGLARSSTDYNSVSWTSPRNIGLFETDAGAPTLNASAGADTIGTTTVAVPLTASDSTVSSGTITYAWTKISGPGTVTFSNAAVAQPTATMSSAGTYVLQVTVSTVESPGTTDFDEVTVVVSDASPPAIATPAILASKVYVLGGLPHVGLIPA